MVRSGPERLVLAPVLLALLGAVPLALSAPWLTWVLLLPLAAGVWVLRARVEASARGLVVCNGLRAHRYAWTDVAGFDVRRRGPVVLLLTGGRRVRLTALARRDVRRLVAVGDGAAGQAAGEGADRGPVRS